MGNKAQLVAQKIAHAAARGQRKERRHRQIFHTRGANERAVTLQCIVLCTQRRTAHRTPRQSRAARTKRRTQSTPTDITQIDPLLPLTKRRKGRIILLVFIIKETIPTVVNGKERI